MSYHKFSNLREIFQGDLTNKTLKGIGSQDFQDLTCNCNAASKINNKCIYNSKCRTSIVVYKATCKVCEKFYVGNTQQHLKKRMNQHFSETRSLVSKNLTSDTFAKHFATHFTKGEKIATKDVRDKVSMDILWKGNPITCVKSFGKINCSLCMKERLLILKALGDKMDKKRLINSNNELYGACRHKPKFHRYTTYNSSADEGQFSPERDTVSTVVSPLYSGNFNGNLNICTNIDTIIFDSNSQSTALISPLTISNDIVEVISEEGIVMDV